MRKTGIFTVLALVVSISVNGFAAKSVNPSTTLSAETGNNTSAADGFQGTSNGNAAAGNVSKVDVRTLMYPGANTSIYAHYMPWFGRGHVNVGYDSADPNQASRTVNDMISRGIQGVIVDWYGRNFTHEDQATQAMFEESQKHGGFKFAIMEDAGAIKNGMSDLVADLTYAWQKYEQAGNYMRVNGRPVVFFFGVDGMFSDAQLSSVQGQIPGNPIFIVENTKGFNVSYSGGAFGWPNGFTGDHSTFWGQPYLNDFYAQAQNKSRLTFGSTWKGFNDGIASWGQGRVFGQACGQTWLNTFAELNRHYSTGNQLANLQLVTWNDYEEGTALEMGIDNCVSVKGSASGSVLSWNISGNENTINHYTVYISVDGQSLEAVTDVPAGTHQLDMSQFGYASGAYTVYVKAVGQPSIRNKMSGPIGYTSTGGSASAGAPAGADLALAATPTTLTVAQGGASSTSVVVTPKGNFNAPVTMGCSGLPAGVTCSFDQAVITPGTNQVTAKLTLKANSGTTTSASFFGTHGTFALWFPGLGFGMIAFGDRKRTKKFLAAIALLAIMIVMMMATGCGGGGGASAFTSQSSANSTLPSQPGTYTFNITAQTGSFQRTTSASLTIQ